MNRPTRRLTDQAVHLLTLNTEPWLSCEDCFELMDVYVDTVLADPHSHAMPEMRVHLAGCPACAEEAQSLLDLVAADSSGPEPDMAGPASDHPPPETPSVQPRTLTGPPAPGNAGA